MTKAKSARKRVKVKNLPKKEKNLTTKEQKQVQGGATRAITPGIRYSTMENDVNPQ